MNTTPKALLKLCDFGSSVAEFDNRLQEYFLETQVYDDFVAGKYDIVSGDKGTGKSAIYRIIKDRYKFVTALKSVEVIPGFNEAGNPVFQRLTQGIKLEEGQHITVWKGFILSTIGNWLLDIAEGVNSPGLTELDLLLKALGLRSKDKEATTIFSQIANLLRTITSPTSAQVSFSVTDAGWPVIIPKVEFFSIKPNDFQGQSIVYNEDALRHLNLLLSEHDFEIWFVLDRLDEAFAGFPEIEIPALRALLRTFLDLSEFTHIKLKLFLRSDLFRRVTQGGFVNLTHVNARKTDIRWGDDDLMAILLSRVRDNKEFMNLIEGKDNSDSELFAKLFPDQVEIGSRKPKTWRWILNRITDGNGVRPPRNLIDFMNKARDAQAKREEREPRTWGKDTHLFEPDALRRALDVLSEQRVNDTLLAENANIAPHIQKFRNGKAEHNDSSLQETLNVEENSYERIKQELLLTGFLEVIGDNYKIPILYRSGLNITQGKGFDSEIEE